MKALDPTKTSMGPSMKTVTITAWDRMCLANGFKSFLLCRLLVSHMIRFALISMQITQPGPHIALRYDYSPDHGHTIVMTLVMSILDEQLTDVILSSIGKSRTLQ